MFGVFEFSVFGLGFSFGVWGLVLGIGFEFGFMFRFEFWFVV